LRRAVEHAAPPAHHVRQRPAPNVSAPADSFRAARAFVRHRFPRRYTGGIDQFLQSAIEEARIGLSEGGIPIGSVLVCEGEIIGRGHNQRVQRGSVIHHAEMNCLENAGRQTPAVYQRCTIYSTLSPCPMCSGAIVLYGVPRLVVGENVTFQGAEEYMRAQGVQIEVVQSEECIALMRDFIRDYPALWNEDIGV
jgi:cytosine deaminase